MNQMYTFHKTVRGYFHEMNGIPCEDASESFSAENDKYHIAIVADGHGSNSCFRSKTGSQIAVKVALECLQEFADRILESDENKNGFYKNIFSDPRFRQTTLRRLTDTIIARWNDYVLADYRKNPPTLEETVEKYENGKEVCIYGTTLIAALQMPDCLILLQQGDGRCEVFWKNGTTEQPIPWDSRCEGVITTSLCDIDAADRFRTYIINLKEKPVIACYLGSDGVEDAYRDTYESMGGFHILMGGVHTFYKDLTCRLADFMDHTDFESYLETMLLKFSANGQFDRSGSGDDISVAGIVDTAAIKQFVEIFQLDVKKYELEERLFWRKDELRRKSRKHEILQNRMNAAQSALKEEQESQRSLKIELGQIEKRQKEGLEKIQTLEDEYRKAKEIFEEYDAKYQMIESEKNHIEDEIAALHKGEDIAYGISNNKDSNADGNNINVPDR